MVNFKPDEYMRKMFIQTVTQVACEPALRGALAAGRERKESLQLRLWNFNSASNSPVAFRAVD